METMMKRCSQCATEIHVDARKCPHCLAHQAGESSLYRPQDRKMVAGVCAAIARQFGIDVTFVRVAVLLTGLVSAGLAFWGYLFIWIVTPTAPGAPAPLARWVDGLRGLFGPKPQGTARIDP